MYIGAQWPPYWAVVTDLEFYSKRLEELDIINRSVI